MSTFPLDRYTMGPVKDNSASESQPNALHLSDDGKIPNSRLPLLVYSKTPASRPEDFEALFAQNGWTGSWRNGVFAYHHYHSNTHEVLGVYGGSAKVLFGGEKGRTVELTAGAAVVIPAGVGHKRISSSPDFAVVGAYPDGRSCDLCRGLPDERPGADRRIAAVPIPESDPVHGAGGPLLWAWNE